MIGDFKPKCAIFASLAFIALTMDWFIATTYSNVYSYASLFTIALVIFFLPFLINYIGSVSGLALDKPTFFVGMVISLYLMYSAVRTQIGDGLALPVWGKLIAISLVLLAAYYATWRVSGDMFDRLCRSLSVAMLFFAFTPMAIAAYRAEDVRLGLNEGSVPTIIMVLDELSFGAEQPIVDSLKEHGYAVNLRAILPSGKNTLNVIPKFFLDRDFAFAQPCSDSAICSGTNVLDFSRISVSPLSKFNVVGFHHPYCRMVGLRYCYQAVSPIYSNAYLGYGCYLLGRAKLSSALCREEELSPTIVNAQRAQVNAAVMQAPFWKEGGLLYVHAMLPHPPSVDTDRELEASYQRNLGASAELVLSLLGRLSTQFPGAYKLIVTSDHPLRKNVWCDVRYATRCEIDSRYLSDFIPLLQVTPNSRDLCSIENNSELFACVQISK